MFKHLLCASTLVAAYAGPAFADPSTPKIHPVEKACISYSLSGQMQSGSITKCHRDFGHESYEIQKIEIGIGGFSQSQNTHAINIGETIYAINMSTKTATKTKNPMYSGLVNAMRNSSPEDMGQSFLTAMGMSPTGQTKTIAGELCNVYSSQMLGTACFTSDWLLVEQDVMGVGGQTATSIDRGSGGVDSNYNLYKTVQISDGPDLSNLPNGLADILGQGN